MSGIDFIGYFGALLVGVILGLIGGGGSILTLPILVYGMALNPIIASAYSLFVVGVSSLIGALKNIQKGLVDFRIALVFSMPAFIAVYSTRKYLIPAIPDKLFIVFDIEITKDIAIMVFFGLIMVFTSIAMLRKKVIVNKQSSKVSFNYLLITIEGIIVGVITGIIGAGGGFLIIPALVLMAKLPMKNAIATSLLIIAIKSLIGFIGDIENLDIDWVFLLSFTSFSIAGIFIGMYINNFIEGEKLKKGFGWLVLTIAIFILIKELAFF